MNKDDTIARLMLLVKDAERGQNKWCLAACFSALFGIIGWCLWLFEIAVKVRK